jgi:hypothetical protein
MTPNFAIIRIQKQSSRGFPIILPLFLLWVPAILLAPLVLVVLGVASIVGGISFFGSLAVFWNLVCSLPGTDVRVCADGNRITVRIM